MNVDCKIYTFVWVLLEYQALFLVKSNIHFSFYVDVCFQFTEAGCNTTAHSWASSDVKVAVGELQRPCFSNKTSDFILWTPIAEWLHFVGYSDVQFCFYWNSTSISFIIWMSVSFYVCPNEGSFWFSSAFSVSMRTHGTNITHMETRSMSSSHSQRVQGVILIIAWLETHKEWFTAVLCFLVPPRQFTLQFNTFQLWQESLDRRSKNSHCFVCASHHYYHWQLGMITAALLMWAPIFPCCRSTKTCTNWYKVVVLHIFH